MKFTMTAVLAAALSSIVSGSTLEKREDRLPGAFTLVSSTDGLDGIIYSELMFANSSACIGNARYESWTEKLEFFSAGDSASFTSFHSSPTGFQTMYVYPAESKPIGFTAPHSAYIPDGAVTHGLSQVDGLLAVNGDTEKWKACMVGEGSWFMYWDGASTLTDSCVPVNVTVVPSNC